MDNLIRTYEGALSDEQCDYLVDMFEQHSALHENQVNANNQTLTCLNLMGSSHSPFREDLEYLSNIFMSAVRKYKDDLGIQHFQFPTKFTLEAMKIKRYEPGGHDSFPPHVDVSNLENCKRYQPGGRDSFPAHVDVTNLENCKRFLVMFIYLTNNQMGQTTLNVKDDLFVSSCKKGNVLLFPPYWPWVHTGEEPVQDSKYILGSYLHYAL